MEGVTWHSPHASALRTAPEVTCAWWAPTAIAVVAVSPRVPSGGAGFASEPWHELQPTPESSTVPSMCRPPETRIRPAPSTVSRWQPSQAVDAGCGEGGGAPWQVPHAVWPSPTFVQTGRVFVPPAASVAPWQ